MDDRDLSFFVCTCMFMTSPCSQEVDSLKCAGNMHSSYYKWKMAITCNPPIMLCATFVPCLGIISELTGGHVWHRVSLHPMIITFICSELTGGHVWHRVSLHSMIITFICSELTSGHV